MKSRFAFGMFAGFAMACLFFFFFLYFYPSAFRAQAAKNSPQYDVIGYYQGNYESPAAEYNAPYIASKYYGLAPAADYEYQQDGHPAPAIALAVPAYEHRVIELALYNSPPASPEAPSMESYLSAI